MNKEKWLKVGRGALIAGLGALFTYVLDASPYLNIPPEYLPLLTATLSIVVNFIRKLDETRDNG